VRDRDKIARILSTATYLPSRRLTNQDLERMVETTEDWIESRTGICERRIAAPTEFASDMGAAAARKALEEAKLAPEEIDLIAVATSSPDYLFPSTAALVQAELGCCRAAAFDFQAACTGYLYGLALAKGLIESGAYRNILLIATERLSTFVDYKDRTTCILFGDGAAASVISSRGRGLSIEHVQLGTDGREAALLLLPAGGCRQPACADSIAQGQHYIKMQGRELFKHAVRRMCQAIAESLERMGLTEDQIAHMVPHQANYRIIQAIARRFNFDASRVYLTIQRYGNTSASSAPIALAELQKEHQLVAGSYIMMPSFGAGLTWGNAILRVEEQIE
jgi:3-oxoacyl-[acyl-carrier-protein] synthase III